MSSIIRDVTAIESAIDGTMEALNQLGASNEYANGYVAALCIVAKTLGVHPEIVRNQELFVVIADQKLLNAQRQDTLTR